MAKPKTLFRLSAIANSCLSNLFQKYGEFVYSFPYIPIIFGLVLLVCLGYGSFSYTEDISRLNLWIPTGSESLDNYEKITETYNNTSRVQTLYATSKTEGENILTARLFLELIEFEELLWSAYSVEDLTYNDICFKSDVSTNEVHCERNDYPLMFFLKADGFDRSHLESDEELLKKINSGKGTPDLFPPSSKMYIPIEDMFGQTIPEEIKTFPDGTNNIQEALAIRWAYFIHDKYSEDFSNKLFEGFERIVEEFNKSSLYVQIYPYSASLRGRESTETAQNDLKLIYYAISLLILYSFYVLGRLDTSKSRIFVSVLGFLGVIFAYYEALGAGTYCGLKGNVFIYVMPFLLLGIGLDDMYVLILTLNQAPEELDGKEKFKFMMKNAGVSISITSLTNVAAFAIGSVTKIPAIRNLCIFLAFGMLFDYINQITFFLGIVAYDIRRSEKGIGDCCGLIFCKARSKACCKGKYIFSNDGFYKRPLSQYIIRDIYGRFLMKKCVKITVILFFTCLAIINIYGVTQLKVEFDSEWMNTKDSLTGRSMAIRDSYFDTLTQKANFFTVYADFTSAEVQEKLNELEHYIDSCEGCGDTWIKEGSTRSWYSAFKSWIRRGKCVLHSNLILLENDVVPSFAFYPCLELWTMEDEGIMFSSKLAWGDSVLVGAAIETTIILPNSAEDTVRGVFETRQIGDRGPEESFPYSNFYLWGDHFAVFDHESTLGLSCSLGVVLLILLISFADILGSILALAMVALTVLGELSFIYFWNEHLNIVTITFTIMAIGVSVDYSSHFVHCYKNAEAQDKNEKTIETLGRVGISIFNGFMSTFLAVLPAIFGEHYSFRLFFKCWFAILWYSLLHALVLLPTVMSLVNIYSHEKVNPIELNKEKSEESPSMLVRDE